MGPDSWKTLLRSCWPMRCTNYINATGRQRCPRVDFSKPCPGDQTSGRRPVNRAETICTANPANHRGLLKPPVTRPLCRSKVTKRLTQRSRMKVEKTAKQASRALRTLFGRSPRDAPKFLFLRVPMRSCLLLCVKTGLLDYGHVEAADAASRALRPPTVTGHDSSRISRRYPTIAASKRRPNHRQFQAGCHDPMPVR